MHQAINGNPDNDLALDCMTNWLEVFSGNVSEISNLCETALTNRPQNPDVLFAQATSLQTVFQDYDRACELLQSSLALAPSSHQMYLAYSVNCMRREQYEDAERSLRAAARLAPSDPFVEICRSKVQHEPLGKRLKFQQLHYKKYKDVKESLTLALRSLSLDPTNLLLVNIVAGQCVELGEYQQAKNLVKYVNVRLRIEAVWLDPSDELTVETFAHVALSNWEEEKREDCFKFLYEVVRDDPTNPRKLIAYSKFLEKHLPGLAVEDREPLMEEAGTWLYELLQERRSDAYFLYHYASFLVGPLYDLEESPGKHMLDSRRAGEMYRCAIALCPQHGEYHFGYAKYLHEITRDYEQSQKEYLTALKFDPNNGLYHLRYAMLLHHHMRDLRRAEEEYVIHLRQCPLDVLALVNYGILLCNGLERFSSAKRILQRAVQLSPDNTDAQLYLNFSIAMENDIPALPESRRKEDAAG
ncbi:hypothetical protein GUITHDRAFT_103662 [Guillardia theta CCMP2712]|uniref:Uncharacterized protein n=1 Tax=Guillardia theta (strain CCMP2712) TaxID=905079 RepID=L1JQ76_GUITC|nr:hypothetical protein GUITHDRAFT_103662 [Guillardia theta CCMP2712]EKX50429.1 hypothetical protein GUITHDRAFT_103662 [Guillardia theta CCMP2712]|eukprot:XP_005837409.1 hypothetical protein GUITHDRAFT_103662 [Guillardia theta CCMP2712]